ncbi:MAG: signal peptidase II [Thioalkalispiraceae bacterium]|jgi:signal peptidase II
MKALIEKLGMLRWLWITVVMVIIDQGSKQWAEHGLEKFTPYKLIPNLNLYLTYNEGAAFSFLSDAGGWQRWFFTIIAIVVGAVIVYWIKTLKSHEKINAIALAFILSGAIGNVIDRILFGKVIDFIQFYYQAESCFYGFSRNYLFGTEQCIWPAFNIADSSIFVGATVLIIHALFEMRKDDRKTENAEAQ